VTFSAFSRHSLRIQGTLTCIKAPYAPRCLPFPRSEAIPLLARGGTVSRHAIPPCVFSAISITSNPFRSASPSTNHLQNSTRDTRGRSALASPRRRASQAAGLAAQERTSPAPGRTRRSSSRVPSVASTLRMSTSARGFEEHPDAHPACAHDRDVHAPRVRNGVVGRQAVISLYAVITRPRAANNVSAASRALEPNTVRIDRARALARAVCGVHIAPRSALGPRPWRA
jgi:hypothetical protein